MTVSYEGSIQTGSVIHHGFIVLSF